MKIQIINSKGHWEAGWFADPKRIDYITNGVLKKAGLEVNVAEVSNLSELNKLLDSLDSDTLVWTNAYYLDMQDEGLAWLNKFVEERGLSLLDSGAQVLGNLLHKDVCQSILEKNSIPVPTFATFSSKNLDELELFFLECDIDYPLVLKPTAGYRSFGVCLVKNYTEAVEKAKQILIDFPESNLIVEEFLPNDDISCAYLELGEDVLLMPTHYCYKNKPGKHHIYTIEERADEVNVNRQRFAVTEKPILKQLETMVPRIAQALDINDISRIDGRMDKEGTLRYFDINGFPGLSYKGGVVSDIVNQAFIFFPNYPKESVYKALINTVVASALMRNNLSVPEIVSSHNLFTLESDLVVRTKKSVATY